MDVLKVGTRKSDLALWQTRWVQSRIEERCPGISVELVLMDTKGDINLEVPLPSVADKGFFTAEIERALFDRDIDIAVHSLKDLPTELPEGLVVGAYCERANAHDVFLGKGETGLFDLPPNARVGTSSLRRIAQIKHTRPDLNCVDLRGNLGTRWRKLQEDEDLAGIVLAAAGVERMGWADRITEVLPYETVLPAPGQGVVAVEHLGERQDVREVLQTINHVPSENAARAERAFLGALDGGCQTPIATIASYDSGRIDLEAAVFSLDGTTAVRVRTTGTEPEDVGRSAADKAKAEGADAILAAIRTS